MLVCHPYYIQEIPGILRSTVSTCVQWYSSGIPMVIGLAPFPTANRPTASNSYMALAPVLNFFWASSAAAATAARAHRCCWASPLRRACSYNERAHMSTTEDDCPRITKPFSPFKLKTVQKCLSVCVFCL